MALDLAGYRTQVRALLVDAGSAVWADATIDQGMRQALGDLARVYGGTSAPTVKDLDSATVTTVEDADASVLVCGAAGYAARSRTIDLSEMHTLGDQVPGALLNGAASLLETFRSLLEIVRRRKLAKSSAVPYTVMVEDEDEDDAMEWDE